MAHLLLPAGADAQSLVFRDGFEAPCLDEDSDRDRLSDCEEMRLATDPFRADSDGDGLLDGDEVLGTIGGLDLPALGVDPGRKDLLLELDWSADAIGCAQHSHRPAAQVIDRVRQVFASAPVSNRDGSTGINLIVDYGQGGAFTGGNLVELPGGETGGLYEPYSSVKAANFARTRIGYFRYQLHAHLVSTDPDRNWGGVAQMPGDDSVVARQCALSAPRESELVIVHELGHNLGLHHGGGDACNAKPNYNSLMNYRFADGLDIDCDSLPDGVAGVLAFSDGSRISLGPLIVNEADGVCAMVDPLHRPVDWNCNGTVDIGTVVDPLLQCDNGPLSDHDDYASMQLGPLTPPISASRHAGVQHSRKVAIPQQLIEDSFPPFLHAPLRKGVSTVLTCPHPSPVP